jgi:hypothetical protein
MQLKKMCFSYDKKRMKLFEIEEIIPIQFERNFCQN